jgi:hypothetical protein
MPLASRHRGNINSNASLNISKYHQISANITKHYKTSPNITKYHQTSPTTTPNVTKHHQTSPNVTSIFVPARVGKIPHKAS